MRARKRPSELTVTETARRHQIIDAAIDVIADEGLGRASFTRIARRAGLSSTGLISYHFAGKADLMAAVSDRVLAEFTEFVLARPDDGTAAGGLRAFCAANLDFMRARPACLTTLWRIRAETIPAPDSSAEELARADRDRMAALLSRGQGAGEFRDFDTPTMAGFILSLRDGVIQRAAREPDLDFETCKTELVAVVELATRKGRDTCRPPDVP